MNDLIYLIIFFEIISDKLIRNRRSHYHELSEESKNIVGDTLNDLFDYFDTRFPRLFIFTYRFALRHSWDLLSLHQAH